MNLLATLVCLYLWDTSVLSTALLVSVIIQLSKIMSSAKNMNSFFKNITRQVASVEEFIDTLETPIKVLDSAMPEKCMMNNGAISFKNVYFKYTNKTDYLIEDMNISIPAGQKVGIVGTSGSGKSTFTKLIMRFMDIQQGSITIDNQDIRNVLQNDLRRQISYVPQEPLLFHRSIEENIMYGNEDKTYADMVMVAEKSHSIEFIKHLPEGYKTLVGERGIKLSGGEKQRISLARSMLKTAPILILDEATSSLDSASEGYVKDALKTLMMHKTVLIVAHRLSTLEAMDRIIVISKGRIIEDGTHHKLLSEDTVYKKLWDKQVNGFLVDDSVNV